jgi:hypothetical protein
LSTSEIIGLKGQQQPAQGNALGTMVVCYKRPAKGKRIAPDEDDQFFCPCRAYIGDNMTPRALPWAGCCWPFGPSSPLSIESVAFVADGIAYTDVYKE